MVQNYNETTDLHEDEVITTGQDDLEGLEWLSDFDADDEQTTDTDEEDLQDADEQEATQDDETITISKKEFEDIKRAKNESYQEWQKLNWVTKIQSDKNQFIKLYESDKKMAQKVLDHFWETTAPEDLYSSLRRDMYGENDPVAQKEEILTEIERKNTKKEFAKLVKSQGIDLDSKKGKEFLEEYNLITDNGRKANTDNVETFINKAIKLSDIETIDTKQKRKEKELPVGHTTRNNAKPSKPKEILNFWGARPSEWYK